MEPFTLIVDWRKPNDCRATKACDGQDDISHELSGLAKALRSHALKTGAATVVLTLKDRSAAGAAARKRKNGK